MNKDQEQKPPGYLAVSKSAPRVFEPVNACIYCDSGEPPFSKEHIIPSGLGGGFILPKSSCEKCRKVTHKIEDYCLRHFLLPHRLHCDLVQSIEEFNGTIRVRFQKQDGKEETEEIPIEEAPNYLLLPSFLNAPGLVPTKSPRVLPFITFGLWGKKETLKKFADKGNASIVQNFQFRIFIQMLAKIAHGISYAEFRGNFKPYLVDIIHGKSEELGPLFFGKWVGDDIPQRPLDFVLNQLAIALVRVEEKILVAVRIKLFAVHVSTPEYMVISGEIIDHSIAEQHGL